MPLAPVEGYNPRVGVDARGRKWPPLRSKQGRLTAPPNRIMQQQWGIPVAQLAPMRSEPVRCCPWPFPWVCALVPQRWH